jgi:hypothetical protein
MKNFQLTDRNLSVLSRSEKNDYLNAIVEDHMEDIKLEAEVSSFFDDDFGGLGSFDFSKDYDYDLNGNPIMFDDAEDYDYTYDSDYEDYRQYGSVFPKA